MNELPPSHPMLHVISAACAVVVSVVIGASIDGLARHYAVDSAQAAATRLAAAAAAPTR